MGSNAREKSIRSGRKSRHSAKPPPDPVGQIAASPVAPNPSPSTDADSNNLGIDQNLNLNPNPNPGVLDDSGWEYHTEKQLEEILLKNLDLLYTEAISWLVSLGYDEVLSLRAILCNGHCSGPDDVLSNIIKNALDYLEALPPDPAAGACACSPSPSSAFSDLRHLQESSLAGLVRLLQRDMPHLTRRDALRCLISNLHVVRASNFDISSLAPLGLHKFNTAVGTNSDPSLGCPRHLDLPPSMNPILRQNTSPTARPLSVSTLERRHSEDGVVAAPPVKDYQDPGDIKIQAKNYQDPGDIVTSMMKSLESMSIGDDETAPNGVEDHKKGMILGLMHQIRELEGQVRDRREWAQEKAMQAARKLSNDMTELKLLRMEREDNQRVKKGKQALEDSTMKRLSEMESALKKASGQVDRANAVVRRLETENAVIRAEMEASKLSASESANKRSEAEKREKKSLKRLSAWEKQREKLQEEVAKERMKISQLQQHFHEVEQAQKETEAYGFSSHEKERGRVAVPVAALSTARMAATGKSAMNEHNREKKSLKRLSAWEKQREKLQKEIAKERMKISQLQQHFNEVEEAHKETEMKWRQEIKAKEVAVSQVDEERRAKEASDASIKRKHETFLQKIEIDFQRHRDDVQRLEQELSRLKASSGTTLCSGGTDAAKPLTESKNARTLRGLLSRPQEPARRISRNRECIVCTQDEVSVVLLPCAHQVLCASCNEEHERRGRATCPCCSVQIEQRIRVYGVNS